MEEPLTKEESGAPTVAEESAEAAKNVSESADADADAFADLPPLEKGDFDEPFTADITETDETPEALPDDVSSTSDVSEDSFDLGKDEDAAVESDPALMEIHDEDLRQMAPVPDDTSHLDDVSGASDVSEDSFDLGKDEDITVESDPALMEILDEDLRQMAPVPDDTSYLDDEKPLELDEIARPESPAPFEPPEAALSEPALQEPALQEPMLQEAAVPLPEEKPDTPETVPQGAESPDLKGVPPAFKQELRAVLSYMDILLESLPEEKIEEFARSEHFEPYKKLFKELGLV
jgi:hypothetical protein